MEEYINMILGNKVFSSGTEIHVYRLCLLIDRCFTDILPNEEMVSRIFQTTTTQSRSLLRSVVSKYQYVLKDIINKTISKLVKDTEVLKPGELETMLIINTNSRFFIELMNEKIASLDVTLDPVSLRPHCSSSYQIKHKTYWALCKEYGLPPKVKPGVKPAAKPGIKQILKPKAKSAGKPEAIPIAKQLTKPIIRQKTKTLAKQKVKEGHG